MASATVTIVRPDSEFEQTCHGNNDLHRRASELGYLQATTHMTGSVQLPKHRPRAKMSGWGACTTTICQLAPKKGETGTAPLLRLQTASHRRSVGSVATAHYRFAHKYT